MHSQWGPVCGAKSAAEILDNKRLSYKIHTCADSMPLRSYYRDNGVIPTDPPSYADVESSDSSPSITPITSPRNERPMRPSLSQSTSITQEARGQPYRPSPKLQSQIDKLGDSSLSLSAMTSNTKTEYFDVLPSFQMFQAILKRNDFEFDEDELGSPPIYGEMGDNVRPPTLSRLEESREIDQLLDHTSTNGETEFGTEVDFNEFEGQYLFSDNESEDGLQRRSRLRDIRDITSSRGSSNHPTSRSVTPHHGFLNHETYGHSVLDNIDMLPHAKTSPLTIEIYVTKGVPQPNQPCELETKLKEYSCGDYVNGFIVITNNSSEDIDFGLFTVSLECTIKAIFRSPKQLDRSHTILQKKPLKMYDLNASYNEGAIPSSAGIEYDYLTRDESDGCLIGLPNERVLKAKEKYKKFVIFRFPDMLLDNACPHGVLRHTMPPPSFGLDESAFHKRASMIEVNKALGYGVLNVRGSPIKLKDYCFDDWSVSYAIEAKFIDKLHAKNQKQAVSTTDINNPDSDSKYVVSKSAKFFLRFIPDIKAQVDTYSRTYNLFGHDTFDTVGIDGMLYSKLAKRQTWRFIERMNLTIEQEIQSALDKREFNGDAIKRKNLFDLNTQEHQNRILPSPDLKKNHFFLGDQCASFEKRKVLFNHEGIEVFGKKKKRLLSSISKIGEAALAIAAPDKFITYGSPKLLQKYNDGRKEREALSSQSSLEDTSQLQPVTSHMMGVYNREEKSVMKNLVIELFFRTSDEHTKPPDISLIELSMVAWSYRTDYPIPISFDHDFFYTKEGIAGAVLQNDDVENTKENLLNLKQSVNHFINFLKETKTHISENTYSYLKGLSKMGIKKDTLRGYFQDLHSSLEFQSDWVAQKVDFNEFVWSKTLNVPLKAVNKNNVTLPPSFQSCLVGRIYNLQVSVKLKGGDETQNVVSMDVPVLVG